MIEQFFTDVSAAINPFLPENLQYIDDLMVDGDDFDNASVWQRKGNMVYEDATWKASPDGFIQKDNDIQTEDLNNKTFTLTFEIMGVANYGVADEVTTAFRRTVTGADNRQEDLTLTDQWQEVVLTQAFTFLDGSSRFVVIANTANLEFQIRNARITETSESIPLESIKKHTFLMLGEEKNDPAKRKPHTIVIMGDTETLERAGRTKNSDGELVDAFAYGTMEIDAICYGSTYESARLMMYALLLAAESIRTADGSRKYPVDLARVSIRYGTYQNEHGFRAARAVIPIGNQGVSNETLVWADLTSVLSNFKLNGNQYLTTEVS